MKIYVTFGQQHAHRVKNATLDKDCVAVIEAENRERGREKAFELFGPEFCFEYAEDEWDEDKLRYFPRGYVHVE